MLQQTSTNTLQIKRGGRFLKRDLTPERGELSQLGKTQGIYFHAEFLPAFFLSLPHN